MIRVRHYGGAEWGIESSSFSPTVRDESKTTPGMRWVGERRSWCGYVDAVDAAATRILAKGLRLDTSTLPDPGNLGAAPVIPVMAFTDLRDYQKVGVTFLVGHAAEGAFLADEVGLGKTLQALRAVRALRGKTVIICPNFLKGVWLTGLEGDSTLDPPTPAGWPGMRVMCLKGTGIDKVIEPGAKLSKTDRDTADMAAAIRNNEVDILIINYDILHAWLPVLLAWGPVNLIFDEGHMLMGDKARRTRAAEELARHVPHRMMLTATPMTSRPRDLWAPVNVLSPGRFGHPFPFFKAHCNAFQERVSAERVVWNTKGSSRLEELQRRLTFFMLRRTKDDVQLQLPPRQRQIIEVDVERQFVVAMAVALQNDASMRRALDMAADGKLPDVARLALSHVEAGHKIVIGTWRKVVAEALADALIQAGVDSVRVITGDVSPKKRAEILKEQPTVTCMTLDLAMGLDMSYADIGLCAELHVVPSKLIQWEGRLHRFRQKRSTLFQYVIGRGTADEIIRDMVIRKMGTFAEGVGKSSDKLMQDLEGEEKSPVEVLKGLYERMRAKQKAKFYVDDE